MLRIVVPILLLVMLAASGSTAQPAPAHSAPAHPAKTVERSDPSSEGRAGMVQMPEQFVLGRSKVTPKVVILKMEPRFSHESWSAVERRLAAELGVLGLEVTHVTARAEGDRERMAELGAQAVAQRALASVRVVHREGQKQVLVWLFDALTGKMLFRQIEVPAGRSEASVVAVAMKTVELLHASLIEVRLPGSEASQQPVPPEVDRIITRRLAREVARARRWSVFGGPALVTNFGEAGTSWGIEVGGAFRFWRYLSVVAETFLPFAQSELSQGEQRAQLAPLIFEGGVRVEPWHRARFSPALGLGIAAMVVRARGRATDPELERTDWAVSAMPTATLRLAVRASRQLRVIAATTLGVTVPPLAVRFAGEEVGRMGRPHLGVTLGVAWSWGR